MSPRYNGTVHKKSPIITWWILGYGDQVQVLAPKVLRKKVVEVAKNMMKLNST